MLFIGQLGTFAGVYLSWCSFRLLCANRRGARRNVVLYAFGTVISLVGTGFLLGVSNLRIRGYPETY